MGGKQFLKEASIFTLKCLMPLIRVNSVRYLGKKDPFEGITTKKGESGFESLFSKLFYVILIVI